MFPEWMFPGLGEHAPAPPPPPPGGLTPKVLREAIAIALTKVSANELAEECVRFGLPAEKDNEDSPWHSPAREQEAGGHGSTGWTARQPFSRICMPASQLTAC